MRKLFLLSAMLVLSSAWLVAQTSSPTGGSASQSSNNETSIMGCLSGSSGSYTLTDSSGKTYQLQGDTSKLSDEVGHQVRVKGSEANSSASSGTSTTSGSSSSSSSGSASNPSSSGTTPSSSPASGASGSSASATPFNVTSVKKIADSCSTPSTPTSK